MKVSDRVYAYMYNAIVNGEWKPGQRIPSENELCKLVDASRTSVRSAIGRLSSIGLLSSRQGEGTFVGTDNSNAMLNTITPMLLLDKPDRLSIFEFRKIVESETASLAAMRATSDMVEKLRDAIARMSNASVQEEMAKYDMKFHYLLAQATNNTILVRVFEVLKSVYMTLFEENVAILGSKGAEYHKLILSAIEIRNPKLAKQYMNEHLDNTIQSIQVE